MPGSSDPILAATRWKSNAQLIEACYRLGFLRNVRTLDPTYGKGNWWKLWRPDELVTHVRSEDQTDFRSLQYEDGEFEQIAYDPPYVCAGGRKTSTVKTMHESYGMNDAPKTPAELQQLINDGLTEMHRLIDWDGIVLVKCQDYVSGGKLWIGTHHTLEHALKLGFEVVDRAEHVGGTRPQPKRTRKDGKPVRQQHFRRNLSTLFVLRARRPRAAQ